MKKITTEVILILSTSQQIKFRNRTFFKARLDFNYAYKVTSPIQAIHNLKIY